MKSFACGDVVPGCDAKWVADTEDELMGHVARHAADVHGMETVPADVVDAVKAKIKDV